MNGHLPIGIGLVDITSSSVGRTLTRDFREFHRGILFVVAELSSTISDVYRQLDFGSELTAAENLQPNVIVIPFKYKHLSKNFLVICTQDRVIC